MPDPIIIGNRFALVDRELISGHVGGIDFGNGLSVIMRSPTHALFWSGGSSYYSHRGSQAYGASGLSAYWRPGRAAVAKYGPGYRSSKEGGYLNIGEFTGGRLISNLAQRMSAVQWAKLAEYLGEDFEVGITQAIEEKKTLLIEGGGDPFAPRPPVFHRPKSRLGRTDFRPRCDECGMHSGEHFATCSVFIR